MIFMDCSLLGGQISISGQEEGALLFMAQLELVVLVCSWLRMAVLTRVLLWIAQAPYVFIQQYAQVED